MSLLGKWCALDRSPGSKPPLLNLSLFAMPTRIPEKNGTSFEQARQETVRIYYKI